MSDLDLGDRLRQESRSLAGPSFTVDDVRRAGRRRKVGRWAAAGAGMTAAAVVVGVALFALPGDAPRPVPAAAPDIALIDWDLALFVADGESPEQLRDELELRPEVAEAQVASQAAVFPPVPIDETASVAPLTADGTPDRAPTPLVVVRLANAAEATAAGSALEALDAVTIAVPSVAVAQDRLGRYFDGLAASAESFGGQPEVLQAQFGPAPQFDVAGLGEEVRLVPLGAPGAPSLPASYFSRGGGGEPDGRDDRYPVVHLGSVGGVHLVLDGTRDGDLCDSTVDPMGGGAAGCGPLPFTPRYGLSGYSTGGDFSTMTVRVPEAASVAAVSYRDVTAWQRPAAGYALFPLDGREPGPVEVVAYLADGTELGRWSSEP